MSEELKFQKLAEVELVEEVSGDAHPLIEEDGKIKRAKGGLGGGYPLIELSTVVTMEEVIALNDSDTERLNSALAIDSPLTLAIPLKINSTISRVLTSTSKVSVSDNNGNLTAIYTISAGLILGIIYPPYIMNPSQESWIIEFFMLD